MVNTTPLQTDSYGATLAAALVAEWPGQAPPAPFSTSFGTEGAAADMAARPRLLVVDDQALNIEVILAVFGSDYQVFAATSGAVALRRCAEVLPHLVLLDVVMPEMDGFEVCTRMKADAALCHIPVIFVTSHNDEAAEVRGLTVGAVDFVSKPINPSTLRARVATHLALQEKTALLLREIAERKAAQQALEIARAELLRSNADLEQFAYAASHDLLEPLRSVASSVTLLKKRYVGRLDERADEFITHAVSGAQRMQTLITDMLALSRLSTGERTYTLVALEGALTQARQNLATALAESSAVITHDALPTLHAQATQMNQLLQNLLANAIKFRGGKPAVVHIGARQNGPEWVISVADQGIGIEAEHFKRIFEVFKRLHTRAEYPGTGIGLALCKKIVENHGGRLWVESEPGQGTTFFFTLAVDTAPPQSAGAPG